MHDPAEDDQDEGDDALSKTQRKQQMHALQALGLDMLQFGDDELAAIVDDDRLREALIALRSMKTFSARRRQGQYIGKLLRDVDPQPLRDALAARRTHHLRAVRAEQAAEQWRERLLGEPGAVTEWVAQHPDTDVQALRTTLRNAQKLDASGAPTAAAVRARRELFRELRQHLG